MEVGKGGPFRAEIPFAEHVVFVAFDRHGAAALEGDLQTTGGFAKRACAISSLQILDFISLGVHMDYTSAY